MCGIIGYVGDKNCARILVDSLKTLEYRGYDSAGIVVVNGKLEVKKAVGRVAGLESQIDYSTFNGTTGMAHTRWATHGKPSVPNSHPHFDQSGTVAVIHNGIIENFAELKSGLLSRGHVFASETDTEVVSHLIGENYSSDSTLEEAVAKTLPLLHGSYALGVVSSRDPGKIVAVRKSSPLVIGVGKGENFIASDVPAFLAHTNKALVVDDGELAVLTPRSVEVFRRGKRVKKDVWKVTWTPEAAKLGGYPYFMLKEIEEQPATIPRVVAQNEAGIRRVAAKLKGAKRVVMLACGTSRHAALIGRYILMKDAGIYCDVMLASEFSHFAQSMDRGTVIIAISQSGETADVMDAVRSAKARGVCVYSIVNVLGSTLTRESDGVIYMQAGPEVGVAATKSFSATVLMFSLLSLALQGRYRKDAKGFVDGAAALVKKTIEDNRGTVKALAEELKGSPAVYFIGRGINFATAIEGALKFKEISYIHAEGMPAGELKHGTLSLVEKGVPVVTINPADDTYEETVSNTMEVRAREGLVIGVSDRPNKIYDRFIRIPEGADPLLYPLLSTVPLQMLAYYVGVARGNDVDKPRNLAKSVTVK